MQEANMNVVNELVEVLSRNASVEDTNRIDKTLAEVLSRHKCSVLHLEWMIERFWGIEFQKYIVPNFDRIYNFLVENKNNEKKKVDLHNSELWFEKCKKEGIKVFCHTTQNWNFLYIKVYDYFIHIRRFWDEYKLDKNDKFAVDESEFFKKEVARTGEVFGIQMADAFSNLYADDFPDNEFIHRPSLKYYRKRNFDPVYNDQRDLGYVATFESLFNTVRGAQDCHALLKLVTGCYIPGIMEDLFEEEIKIEGKLDTWLKPN